MTFKRHSLSTIQFVLLELFADSFDMVTSTNAKLRLAKFSRFKKQNKRNINNIQNKLSINNIPMQKKITFALGNATESFYFRSVHVGNRSLATVAPWGETLFLKRGTPIFINSNFLNMYLLFKKLLLIGGQSYIYQVF